MEKFLEIHRTFFVIYFICNDTINKFMTILFYTSLLWAPTYIFVKYRINCDFKFHKFNLLVKKENTLVKVFLRKLPILMFKRQFYVSFQLRLLNWSFKFHAQLLRKTDSIVKHNPPCKIIVNRRSRSNVRTISIIKLRPWNLLWK